MSHKTSGSGRGRWWEKLRSSVLLAALLSALPLSAQAEDASQALRHAVRFFREKVSTQGGYLWQYSADLKKREGERKTGPETIWVQPPGTPTVGLAMLQAYEATGDRYYLDGARAAGDALVRGQLRCGGWTYRIEFGARQRKRWAYRVDPAGVLRLNHATLDDNTTQAALRLLMRLDQALQFKEPTIHEAALFALDSLLKAQHPNGAWSQVYDGPTKPAEHTVKQAAFPDDWPRTYPGHSYYWDNYTFNDNVLADMIDVMFLAARVYQDGRYRQSAQKAGGFILLAQLPEPQPAWAQQYNLQMHPSWARKFEPPAITGGESQGVLRTLLTLYRQTGDRRYLEPVPRALAWFRRSRLPDGRVARFYELRTNRPLYFTRQYELTYDNADPPNHYAFQVGDGTEGIARRYEQLSKMSDEQLAALRQGSQHPARQKLTPTLTKQVAQVIASLDSRGAWVDSAKLRYHGKRDPTRKVIRCQTFVRNVKLLCDYLAAAR